MASTNGEQGSLPSGPGDEAPPVVDTTTQDTQIITPPDGAAATVADRLHPLAGTIAADNPMMRFARNSPFLAVSLFLHLVILFLLTLWTGQQGTLTRQRAVLRLEDLPEEEMEMQPLMKPTELTSSGGGGGFGGGGSGSGETSAQASGTATSVAITPISVLGIESPVGGGNVGAGIGGGRGDGEFGIAIGAGGPGTGKSLEGAVDQFAAVTLSSMQRGETLVALVIDQSRSVIYGDLPKMIQRMDRYFDEIERNLPANLSERGAWVIVSFGRQPKFRCEPSYDIRYLKEKMREVEVDESGAENTGAAIELVLNRFGGANRKYKYLLIGALTDEAGDDINNPAMLERVINRMRADRARFYVFGYESTFCARKKFLTFKLDDNLTQVLRGKDRDAVRGFEGQTAWGWSDGGPECPLPELWWGGNWWQWQHWGGSMDGITAGFGMYGLNRMVLATGGIYFLLKEESKYNEEKLYSEYKPDMCSVAEYLNRVKAVPMKGKLAEIWNEIGQYYMPYHLTNVKQVQEELDRALIGRNYCMQHAIVLKQLMDGAKPVGHNWARWQAHADITLAELMRFRFMLGQYHEVLRRWMKDKDGGVIPDKKWLTIYRGKVPDDYVGPEVAKQEHDLALQQIQLVIERNQGTPWQKMGERMKANVFPWKATVEDIPKGGPSPPVLNY